MTEHIQGAIMHIVFTTPPYTQSPACLEHAVIGSSWSLSSDGHCQSLLRIQYLVGFSTAGERYRITIAFVRRSICRGYCIVDLADLTSIIDTADHTLFHQIFTNPVHVLAHLSETVNVNYQLRPKQDDRQLQWINSQYKCL